MLFGTLRLIWNRKRINHIKKHIKHTKKLQIKHDALKLTPVEDKIWKEFHPVSIEKLTLNLENTITKLKKEKISHQKIAEICIKTYFSVSDCKSNLHSEQDVVLKILINSVIPQGERRQFYNDSLFDISHHLSSDVKARQLKLCAMISQKELVTFLTGCLSELLKKIQAKNIEFLSRDVVSSQFSFNVLKPQWSLKLIDTVSTKIVNNWESTDSAIDKLKIKAIKLHGNGVINIKIIRNTIGDGKLMMGDIVRFNNRHLVSDNPKNSLKSVKLLKTLENKNKEFASSSEH